MEVAGAEYRDSSRSHLSVCLSVPVWLLPRGFWRTNGRGVRGLVLVGCWVRLQLDR